VTFTQVIELVGKVVDGVGVAIIAAGVLLATWRYLTQWRHEGASELSYQRYREWLGRAILLGLEFLVAGDIIRTVAVTPTFVSVGVLAIIVLIRTFLSLELGMEVRGYWPWQRPRTVPTAPASATADTAHDSAASEETGSRG
jgi:uncharacterized membrane protein